MKLYYKTLRTTETGKKFVEIFERQNLYHAKTIEFVERYGFKSYRPSIISFGGCGISSLVKPEGMELDKNIWKESGYGDNEYFPRESTKVGKVVYDELKALPIVDIDELNGIVGYEGDEWKSTSIGYSNENSEYVGFIVLKSWNCKIPSDCIEITGTEYDTLFLKEEGLSNFSLNMEKAEEPVTPEVTSECYHLRTESGDWLGQIVLTSDGAFMSITEWGNFNFAWRSYKTLPDFKKFLVSLDSAYFSNKMYQGVNYQMAGRKVQGYCDRFAVRILPALKKVLQAELNKQQP